MKFLLACVLAWLMALSSPAAPVEPLPPQFMPSSEVRAGMIGEGRTVFHGYKVEPFKAEILGVRHNALPGANMIIAKLEGPMLAGHGVVAGMSGSPVFINGRLIGAVAYGWSFAYEPICGITPIESMWQVWNNIGNPALAKQKPRSAGAPLDISVPWDWESDWSKYNALLNGTGEVPLAQSSSLTPQSSEFVPLMTPLFVSGASPSSIRPLSRFLKSRGLELINAGPLGAGAAGPDGEDRSEPAPPIEPGSALGVPLLLGDINMAGVGTVTWRDGDKLIAFGHPMMAGGGVATPMSAAWILGFMESYERSFKLGDVRNLVGTIDQDRVFAIGGKLGDAPPFVPINVTISGPAAANPRVYKYRAFKDADFLPTLTMAAISSAWTNGGGGGEMTLASEYEIKLGDGRTINKRAFSSSDGGALSAPVMMALFDLFALLQNPFHEADVASIDVKLDARVNRRDQLELIALSVDHSQFQAGDTVRMRARIRPWRAAEQDRAIELKLPQPLKPGTYIIQLADSGTAQQVEKQSRPGIYAPRQFEDVLALVGNMNFSSDELRLYLFQPAATMVLKGKPLGAIPTSMEALVRTSAPAQLQQTAIGNRLDTRVMRMESPVTGSASLAIEVVDHFDE